MKAKEFIPATKPRNFVAKNQQTAGAGAHRDKKKEQKQGDVKHKNKQFEQGVDEDLTPTQNTHFTLMNKHRVAAQFAKGAEKDKHRMAALDHERALRNYAQDEVKHKGKDIDEGSDWGEPREILEDVLQTLEREVEWPLTEVMDAKQVRQLLAPIIRAVNDKLLSMDRDGNQ